MADTARQSISLARLNLVSVGQDDVARFARIRHSLGAGQNSGPTSFLRFELFAAPHHNQSPLVELRSSLRGAGPCSSAEIKLVGTLS